jgi:hypothetical protein
MILLMGVLAVIDDIATGLAPRDRLSARVKDVVLSMGIARPGAVH